MVWTNNTNFIQNEFYNLIDEIDEIRWDKPEQESLYKVQKKNLSVKKQR